MVEGLIVIIIGFEVDHNGYNILVGAKRLEQIIGLLIACVRNTACMNVLLAL